jgi:hypothetical protein
MLPRELRRSLNEQAYGYMDNNVKRFEQAFGLEKRYRNSMALWRAVCTRTFLRAVLVMNNTLRSLTIRVRAD